MALWDLLVLQGSPAAGVVLVPMEPGECQVKPVPRVTGVSMALLDSLERKDIEVNLDLRDHQGHQERMEKEEMMERSDLGDFQVNLDPVVCWDLKDLQDPLDLLV